MAYWIEHPPMRYRRSCVQKLIALSLMLPTIALGQGLDVASDAMKMAGERLSSEPQAAFRMTGDIKIEGRPVSTFAVNGYLRRVTGSHGNTVNLALFSYEDGRLVRSYHGDGVQLWSFSVAENSYSASQYGDFDGYHGATTVRNGALQLVSQTRGWERYVARTMDFALGGYQKSAFPFTQDLPEIKFKPATNQVLMTSNGPTPTITAMNLNGDGDLVSVSYSKLDELNGKTRETSFSIWITRDPLPTSIAFGFVPPKGSVSKAVKRKG